MHSYEFLLCCCSYLNGESEKQTHLCPDYWAVGLTGCQIIATLPKKIAGGYGV